MGQPVMPIDDADISKDRERDELTVIMACNGVNTYRIFRHADKPILHWNIGIGAIRCNAQKAQ